jgi:uncharacterized membrane protein
MVGMSIWWRSLLEFKKLIVLFIMGFIGYIATEVIFGAITGGMVNINHNNYFAFQGYSSLWMGIVGGIILIILSIVNEIKFFRRLPMFYHALIGCIIITSLELISGLFLNILCRFKIWDYSNLWFNYRGQICLLYSFFWFSFSPMVFWLSDTLKWVFYKIDPSMGTRQEYNIVDYYRALFNFKTCLDVKK